MISRDVHVSRFSFDREYEEWAAEGTLELWGHSVRWIARWALGIGWELELPNDLVREEDWERDLPIEIGDDYRIAVRRELQRVLSQLVSH